MPKQNAGGRGGIMARVLTVLIALVAQGMALMSPVCFVRCVSANGHECLELTGRGCQRCDGPEHEPHPHVSSAAKCHEQDAPRGSQIAEQHCSCQHSPLASAPQVQVKSLTSSGESQVFHVATLPALLDFVSVVQALEKTSLSAFRGLRPHESPQLTALATIVLRV